MSLSNDIITHQIEPVIFDQRRCEFRIDPKVWLSNWRLSDLGIIQNSAPGSNDEKQVRYASHLGAYALIDRIRLLNGNVELAEMRNVNQYLAFENLQRTNANSYSVNRVLNKSSFALDMAFDASNNPLMDLKDYAQGDTVITNDANTTPLSFLDLQQVLPLLKAQSYVLGTELQSLRLIIEWVPKNSDAFKKVFVGETPPDTTVAGTSILQPTLIIDEVADEGMARKLKNSPITYINMDHEVVNVPANSTSTVQHVNQRLRAFDDKRINRMLMLIEDPVNKQPSAYLAGLTSYVQYKQKVQFSLNGGKMLPYEGITNPNQQVALLNDTFGTHILPQGSQLFDLANKTSLYKTHDVFNKPNQVEANNLVGQMSYVGMPVNSSIDELSLEYQRAPYDAGSALSALSVASIAVGNPTQVTMSGNHNLADDDLVVISGVVDDGGLLNDLVLAVTKTGATTFTVPPNTTGETCTATSAKVTPANDSLKQDRSKAQINLLFWAECLKVLKVSNNNVQISNVD